MKRIIDGTKSFKTLYLSILVTVIILLNVLEFRVNPLESHEITGDSTKPTGPHPSVPRLVETSHQCSSILNYIYSGLNLSIDEPASFGEVERNNATKSQEFRSVSSWLPSIQDLWDDTIHPKLLSHVLQWVHSALGEDSLKIINQTRMDRDFQLVHNEFILSNLRKSIIHPMDSEHMNHLLRIIELRLADPSNHPPLEIMTFGPSVVEGVRSNHHNWWLPDKVNNQKEEYNVFAWPTRLEDVLNNVIFRGQNVVRVTNLGSGGTLSTSGTLAMQYRLFADAAPVPDVVIHSYAHTDTRHTVNDESALLILQNFVLATKKVRCNRDGLPYVILYDDFLGFIHGDGNEFNLQFTMKNLRAVSQTADWYNVMAASYAKAFRHTVYSGEGFGQTKFDQGDLYPNPSHHLPMLGWALDVHPGLLYHSTAPWVLAFNLIDNIVNSCNDFSTIQQYSPSYSKLSTDLIPAATADKNLRDLPRLWRESIALHEENCRNAPGEGKSPCSRVSWVVNGSSGRQMQTPRDVESYLAAMSMESLDGWFAEGRRLGFGKPRVGWVANRPNATFTVTIKDMDHEGIRSMSIVSLKSYGRKWEDSRMRVTVWDQGKLGQGPLTEIGQYEMEGFHDLEISIYFDHNFNLGESGVPRGNWLKAQFDLVGGSTFKIQGILFCSW